MSLKLKSWRPLVVAAILSFAAVSHAWSAIKYSELGLPLGMSLALLVYTIGDLTAVYGLVRRRYWARCMTQAIALVTFMQISATGLLLIFSSHAAPFGSSTLIYSGIIQALVCIGMATLMGGVRMRNAFEERSDGPWRFDSRLAKLIRIAVIGSIGVIPMLFWMSAHAVYAVDDIGRWMAVIAGLSMIVSILTIIKGRTIGLAMLALSSMVAAVAITMTVASLDTNPNFAGQAAYWSLTLAAAIATVPGIIMATLVFFACVPKLLRLLRNAE